MNSSHIYAAVETGGTKTLCRVVAGERTLAERRWETASPDAMASMLSDFIQQATPDNTNLRAVGLAAFGPIIVDPASADYGLVLNTPKLGWSDSNLRLRLSERLGVPIVLDTDVNAAALAEQAIGAGRNCDSVAYVTIGTGIGAGLVRNGRTLRGALHPELGHMRIVRQAGDAVPSTCPFHSDCVEGLAAGPAINARLQGRATLVDAQDVVGTAADYLGQLFASAVLAWSPTRIIVGGGVMQTQGLIEQATCAMHASLGGYGVGSAATHSNFIVPAHLENAGLEGALMMARDSGGQV